MCVGPQPQREVFEEQAGLSDRAHRPGKIRDGMADGVLELVGDAREIRLVRRADHPFPHERHKNRRRSAGREIDRSVANGEPTLRSDQNRREHRCSRQQYTVLLRQDRHPIEQRGRRGVGVPAARESANEEYDRQQGEKRGENDRPLDQIPCAVDGRRVNRKERGARASPQRCSRFHLLPRTIRNSGAQQVADQPAQGERAGDVENQADDPVRPHAPDLGLRNSEREIRGEPHLETEGMGGVVPELLSREKHPVVEYPRIAQEGPVQGAGERRDQSCADPKRMAPDVVLEHKKRYPEGYLFSRLSCYQPRQEPGRYFPRTVVPSPVLPQRQPKSVWLPTSAWVAGVVAFVRGTSVSTPALQPDPQMLLMPCVVTMTLPFTSVLMVFTYFEAPVVVVVTSQPQPPATMVELLPLWKTSVIDVRQAL